MPKWLIVVVRAALGRSPREAVERAILALVALLAGDLTEPASKLFGLS